MTHDETLEVISWDPEDHLDLPGFAHGLSRYGGHWFDIGISVMPGEQDHWRRSTRCSPSCAKP